MEEHASDTTVSDTTEPVNKYRHLPPRPRPEELRTSQDVVPYGEPVGEADREREWLLRTSGIFM